MICLPDVTYSGTAGVGSGPSNVGVATYYVTGPGTFSIIAQDPRDFLLGEAVAQGNVRIAPTPVIAVSAGASAGVDFAGYSGGSGLSVGANITYYFEVVGPPSSVPISIISKGTVDVSGAGQGLGDSVADASLSIFSTAQDHPRLVFDDVEVTDGGSFQPSTPDPDSFGVSGDFSAAAGQIYEVSMGVSVAGHVSGIGSGNFVSVYASVDPQILIDPGFSSASQYTLVFSPGVGDGPISSVPELSIWAMMLTGFAALAYLRYRAPWMRGCGGGV